VPVNSQLLRHPRERIVHGTVGLVRVSSGWGAFHAFLRFLRTFCGWARRQTQIVLPGMASHTPHLIRLVRTFLHKGGKMMTSTKGGQQPAKEQGAQIN